MGVCSIVVVCNSAESAETEEPAMEYGAIDLHKRYTWIRIITSADVVTLERRVPTTREQLTAVFPGVPAPGC